MPSIKSKHHLMPLMLEAGDPYSEREDVECQLNLTGKLFNPDVKLNIELPNSDEQKRAILRNTISTEEELSRQFLYLLITNSFLADDIRISATNTQQQEHQQWLLLLQKCSQTS